MASTLANLLVRAALFVIALALVGFMLLPLLIVIPMSFSETAYLTFPPVGFSLRWYESYFADPSWRAATLFSLQVALLTMIASVAVGVPAAIALTRSLIPGKTWINALILAPLVVPQIITAVALYLDFAALGLNGTVTGFVIAHTILAVPFVVIIVSAALHGIDPSLELAALNLGASRLRVTMEVTIPLVLPGIAGSAIFAFLTSFDEAVVSFFISGVENKTITRKIFEDIDFNLSPTISAVATILILITVSLAAASKIASRNRQNRL